MLLAVCAGDLSTDNWLVNMFAFGDGWHNTHHAFPTSARHGLQVSGLMLA